MQPRFVAVLAIDVVGYTRLMATDRDGTLADLAAARELLASVAEGHGGRLADVAGDAAVAVFDTAAGAVYAARAIQSTMAARAAAQPPARRMLLRVGAHIGDVVEQADGSVYGDAVNIAARLESLAPAGGIAVSGEVQAAVDGATASALLDQGDYDVKHVARPVRVYLLPQEGGSTDLGPSTKAFRLPAKGNLPLAATDLLGRAEALRDVRTRLDTARLVTVTGMGGMGKTQLTIDIARRAAPDFPDGAWFVDLAAVADGSAVPHAVAGVFSVTQQNGRSVERALVETLGNQRLLLVMDNCEHVGEAVAGVLDAILMACPQIKILATSREALSIPGEQVWPLDPLAPDAATALFVARAQAAHPGFDTAPENPEIGHICQALDGIPLAIELAAARVRSLSLHQIRTRLAARFRLLTAGSRAARARHQTLRQAVQWSVDLLDATERDVLARAAVFAGGFTLDAAERVCAGGSVDAMDVCDALDSLVRKSLVTAGDSVNGIRYGMLETIRAFGLETLDDAGATDPVRQAHACFYADDADRYFAHWRSPRQREAHVWLDLEINNLRDAFWWAHGRGDVDSAARIASSVGDMGRFRLIEEAATWAEEIVEQARAAGHPRLIVLLTWSASSAWAFQRFDDAERFGEEALQWLDTPGFDPFVWAYGDLAFVRIFAGDIDAAIGLLATGANHPADQPDRFMMAFHLFVLATAGRTDAARRIADDVVARVEAAGVPMAVAVAYGGKGAALEPVDERGALACYESGIDVARQAGARFMETLIAPRIAALHARSGEPVVALRGFARMLESFGDATDIASVSATRAALVVLFSRIGLYLAAATLHGTLADTVDTSGIVPAHAEAIKQVRDTLSARVFSAAVARGVAMSLREGSAYASVQVDLALETFETRATG